MGLARRSPGPKHAFRRTHPRRYAQKRSRHYGLGGRDQGELRQHGDRHIQAAAPTEGGAHRGKVAGPAPRILPVGVREIQRELHVGEAAQEIVRQHLDRVAIRRDRQLARLRDQPLNNRQEIRVQAVLTVAEVDGTDRKGPEDRLNLWEA